MWKPCKRSLRALLFFPTAWECATRFWATIWIDECKTKLEPPTRRNHLSALDRLYAAVKRQRSTDCLDQLILDVEETPTAAPLQR